MPFIKSRGPALELACGLHRHPIEFVHYWSIQTRVERCTKT